MSEWIEVRLRDLCSSVDYGLTASAVEEPLGPRFLRITDIVNQSLSWDRVPYVQASAEQKQKYRLHPGDIVIARTGATTGASRWIEDPPDSVFASYLVRLKISSAVDSRFVGYLLKGNQFKAYVQAVTGDKSAQPNASATTLANAPLRIPAKKSAQQAIAALLGALDDKITLNERIAATVDELAAVVFEASMADDSEEVQLGEVATVNRTSVKAVKEGSLRYVDISSVGVGSYEWPQQIQWLEAPGRARRKAAAGDTIWSTVRPNRRSHALVLDDDPDLVFSTGLAVLSPVSIGPATLYEATKVPEFQAYLESVAEGSAYPAVRAEQFNNAVLSIPVADKRAWFEDAAMSLRIRAHHASVETRALAKLRDSLLPQLMSGRIRVKDAEKLVEDAV